MARSAPPVEHQFKKGQSGNPKGRPKKLPKLDDMIAEVLGDETRGVTAAMAILKKMKTMAKKGNLKAAEMLFDRGYGKPKQKVELEVDSVKIKVVKKK